MNLGIMGLCLSALDLHPGGRRRDAVCGVPVDYAQAVIDQSLSMIATIVTSEQLLAVWASSTE
ncbi:MAG: hypothetical protein U0W40_03630 [Acidimicrobiia bacterium]